MLAGWRGMKTLLWPSSRPSVIAGSAGLWPVRRTRGRRHPAGSPHSGDAEEHVGVPAGDRRYGADGLSACGLAAIRDSLAWCCVSDSPAGWLAARALLGVRWLNWAAT